MASEKTPTMLERFQIFMDNEKGAGKLITYGIASAGLCIALYKIRPFTKFKKPVDVPLHFLQSRVPLQGTVMHVRASNGVLLMVNHHPLLPFLQFNSNKSYLPVKIAGVDVTGNGISWLQFVVNGNRITFIPIKKKEEYLECLVIMPQKDQDSLRIGEELIKLGLATVHKPWFKIKNENAAYKRSLVNAQKWATRKRNGYWQFAKQPTILWKTQMFLINTIRSLLPSFIVKQLNL